MRAIPTWILVADGGQAYVIEQKSVASGLKKVPNMTFQGPRKLSRELGTDKPGRTHESVGAKRAAYGDDKQLAREAEEKFLRGVVAKLEQGLKDGAFERLVLAAPPRVLGVLRKHLSPHLAKALWGEIRADLVKSAIDEIAQHLSELKR